MIYVYLLIKHGDVAFTLAAFMFNLASGEFILHGYVPIIIATIDFKIIDIT